MEFLYPRVEHLFRLTDDTGIIQHSKFSIPDPRFGYTTDDNSRALIVAIMLYKNYKEERYLDLIYRYSSFILNAQTERGTFKNFMSYNRVFLDEDGSEDCFGRVMWSLGFGISDRSLPVNLRNLYKELFHKALPYVYNLKSPRGKAYAILGIYYAQKDLSLNTMKLTEYMKDLSKSLVRQFRENVDSSWRWFEDIIAYSNAILPLALLLSYKILKDEIFLEVSLDSMKFLEKIVFRHGYFKPIGCNGWYVRGGQIAEYDEQPIEASEMVLLYKEAYEMFKDVKYINKAKETFMWYHGRNSKGVNLIDPETGGCYDGINEVGVNLNQGAESIISYLMAYLTMKELVSLRKEALVS